MNDSPCKENLISVFRAGANLISMTAKAEYYVLINQEREFLLRSPDFEKERIEAEELRQKALDEYNNAVEAYNEFFREI